MPVVRFRKRPVKVRVRIVTACRTSCKHPGAHFAARSPSIACAQLPTRMREGVPGGGPCGLAISRQTEALPKIGRFFRNATKNSALFYVFVIRSISLLV